MTQFEGNCENLKEEEEEIQAEISQAQTPPVTERNKKPSPAKTVATVEQTKPKEILLGAGERKRQAPKIPTKEEGGDNPEKSPLKLRNVRKVGDKPKRQTPKTGWL